MSGTERISTYNRDQEEVMNEAVTEQLDMRERMESRGIPAVPLLEDVEQYLSTTGITVDEALKRNEENQQKYKIVECSFVEQLTKLKASVDDYEKSLAALAALDQQKAVSKEGTDITYKLDENLYSKARVKEAEKICIYLGAYVMVEYGMVEGKEILEKNLKNVKKSTESLSEELDFIRDQITTTEVNVAQLHNHRVEQNRKRPENLKKK